MEDPRPWTGTPAYTAVLFDLDGTLYDRDALVLEIANAQFDAYERLLPAIGRDRFVHRIVELDDHGMGDKLTGYRSAIQDWGLEPELAEQMLSNFWEEYDGLCRQPDDTRQTLATLRRAGFKLGVITNGRTDRQSRKLDSMGLTEVFDTILISEAEGVRKPHREIFDRALRRIGAEPREALFVGDNPEADISGALRAGLDAIWRYAPHWDAGASQVPTVTRLEEILPHCFR